MPFAHVTGPHLRGLRPRPCPQQPLCPRRQVWFTGAAPCLGPCSSKCLHAAWSVGSCCHINDADACTHPHPRLTGVFATASIVTVPFSGVACADATAIVIGVPGCTCQGQRLCGVRVNPSTPWPLVQPSCAPVAGSCSPLPQAATQQRGRQSLMAWSAGWTLLPRRGSQVKAL